MQLEIFALGQKRTNCPWRKSHFVRLDHLVAKRRSLGGVFKRLDFALLELKGVDLSQRRGTPSGLPEMMETANSRTVRGSMRRAGDLRAVSAIIKD